MYQGSKSRQHLDSPPRACLSNSQTPAFSVLAAARFLLQLSRSKRLSIPLRFLFPRKPQLTHVPNTSTAGSTMQRPDSLPRHYLGPSTQPQISVFPASVAPRLLIRSKRLLTPLTFLFPNPPTARQIQTFTASAAARLFQVLQLNPLIPPRFLVPYNRQWANLPNSSTARSPTRQHLDSPSHPFPNQNPQMHMSVFPAFAAARWFQPTRPKRSLILPRRNLFPRQQERGKRLETTGCRDSMKPWACRAVSHRRSTVFKASAAQVPPASVHIRTHTHTVRYVSYPLNIPLIPYLPPRTLLVSHSLIPLIRLIS